MQCQVFASEFLERRDAVVIVRSDRHRAKSSSPYEVILSAAKDLLFRQQQTIAASFAAERLDPGLRAAEDESVDVVRALVGVDDLEVEHVAHDAELVGDAVAPEHVA